MWAIEGSRGEYIAHTEFPEAGDWKAIFTTQAPGEPPEAIGVAFQVQETLPVIAVGQKAPASNTPDGRRRGRRPQADLAPTPTRTRSSTRCPSRMPSRQGKPFVLVFATPAFCQSAQCGPTLDRVKKVAASAPANVVFINVEPYKMTFTEGRLQPVLDAQNQLQPIHAVNEWGILSEPWIFAVDGTGIVRGSFEGIVSDGPGAPGRLQGDLRDVARVAGDGPVTGASPSSRR